jgi:2-oxoacid:acceptor oxidoreductase delta subunit (pyruvate/2-ketoisovalerate family)
MKIPYAEPGSSIKNKTGTWRSFRPQVDANKCVKCGICHNFCPEGIMGNPSKVPEIDMDYCKGCGICANECPRKAIVMAREQEKK